MLVGIGFNFFLLKFFSKPNTCVMFHKITKWTRFVLKGYFLIITVIFSADRKNH